MSSVDHSKHIPEIFTALGQAHAAIDAADLDRSLRHLIQLRASQINRCAYCVKMHAHEARQDGETNDRLDRLVIWRQVADFSSKERAALALTETLTLMDHAADMDALRADAREHFSDQQIGALVATIAMINLWNRMELPAR